MKIASIVINVILSIINYLLLANCTLYYPLVIANGINFRLT